MLAAYTIQLWFPPRLRGFGGGGVASRIQTVQTSRVNNVPCNRNLLSSFMQAAFAILQVWGLDEAILKLPGKKAIKQHKGWVVKYLPRYRCSSFL